MAETRTERYRRELVAYASAWLAEHRFCENFAERRNEHGTRSDLHSDEEWHRLLQETEEAHVALGLNDYVDAQEAIFADYLALVEEGEQ